MTSREELSELISAFLDGEITPEEQARVEERLVDNAKDRRLFEEMRAMRDGLQALPRHKLDRDLSESILRRAEREMLVSGSPESSGPSEDAPDTPQQTGQGEAAIIATTPPPAEPKSWRPFIWAGLATAAAVLVMVVSRPWSDEAREVASGTKDKSPPATADRTPLDIALAPHNRSSDGTVGKMPASANGISVRDEASKDLGWDSEEFDPGDARRTASGGYAGKLDVQDVHGIAEGEGALAKVVPPNEWEDGKKFDEGGAVASDSTLNGPFGGEATELPPISAIAGRANKDAGAEFTPVEIPTDRVLLVTLDVYPEAAQMSSFDDSLTQNDIRYESLPDRLVALQKAFAARGSQLGDDADHDNLHESRGRQTLQDQVASVDYGDVELVIVEARADQICGLLNGIKRQPRSFRIVDVDAGPSGRTLDRTFEKTAPPSQLAQNWRSADGEEDEKGVRADTLASKYERKMVATDHPTEEAVPQAAAKTGEKASADTFADLPAPATERPLEPEAKWAAVAPAEVADEPSPVSAETVDIVPGTPPAPNMPEPTEEQAEGDDDGAPAAGAVTPQVVDAELTGSLAEDSLGGAAIAPGGFAPMKPGAGRRQGGDRGGTSAERFDPADSIAVPADGAAFAAKSQEEGEIDEVAMPKRPAADGAIREEEGTDEEKSTDKERYAHTNAAPFPSDGPLGKAGQLEQDEETQEAVRPPEADFGAASGPGARETLKNEVEGQSRSSGARHSGFAHKLRMPRRDSWGKVRALQGQGQGAGTPAPSAPSPANQVADDSGAAPPALADSDAYHFGGGGRALHEEARRKAKIDVPKPSSPQKLVRVLFVLRRVEPMVDVAADVAAEEPPAAAARVRALAVEQAAEVEAAEAAPVMEAAEPAGR